MVKRKCCGYIVDPNLAAALEKLLRVWSSRVSHPRQASLNGIGKQPTNCSPMKNISDGYCSKKQPAPGCLKSKTMASWIGIYHTGSHEAIISDETFRAVQKEKLTPTKGHEKEIAIKFVF